MRHYNLVIIGAGAAGISVAKEVYRSGCRDILLIERKAAMGGVLLQCMHRGFGDDLDGPAYAAQLLTDFPAELYCQLNTTVLHIDNDKTLTMSHAENGIERVSFDRLILATGCREIPAGALPIAGTRPEGVYTAGQMQEMMNLYGEIPDGPVVILGSGDLGLIMAAQIASKGIAVTIVEQNTACGGMECNRRRVETLPVTFIFNTSISELCGERCLEGVKLRNGAYLPCKTVLIAVGMQPNQELQYGLGSPEWLYLCGNCNRIHTMVESVVWEGKKTAGKVCEQVGGVR